MRTYPDLHHGLLTDKEVEEALAEALQSWPLYRQLRYLGGERRNTVPELLTLVCDNCGKEQLWRTGSYGDENNMTGFSSKEYTCRNCDHRVTRYYLYWARQTDKSVLFFKVGQYPELEEWVSPSLQKALGKDLKLYKNAIRLRNFNLGIGAIAYMRRIIENHMNDLLDTIFEAAQSANIPPETVARLGEIKASRGFQDKIAFAESLLPPRLRPDGVAKPFAVLYDLTSDGLHARSEDECIAVFDGCRKVFEYIFAQIHQENLAARQFKADLAAAPNLKPVQDS